MTDAKEPAAIAALREVVHPTSVGTVPIVYADILQAWDTLTRERDALLGVLEQARPSVTSEALLGLIDAALTQEDA
jgi:hypothetical protein